MFYRKSQDNNRRQGPELPERKKRNINYMKNTENESIC